MSIRLAYGDTQLQLRVPSSAELHEFSPQTVDRPLSFEEFKGQYTQSLGHEKLSAASPLIVVNDAHRATPTSHILSWLDRIDDSLLDRAVFLVAAGTHPAPDDKQLQTIFGDHLERVRERVNVHDARNYESMTRIGEDPLGGEVWIDSRFAEASDVIVISSAEPHYFAGFSGGRKSFFPGLTDFATVERNHNLANSLDCAPLKLAGNPMAEHLEKLLEFVDVDKVFSIQVVFDASGKVVKACMGDLRESFLQAAAISESIFSFDTHKAYDVVVCEILPPLDRSLYQAQKAVENCRAAVKPGGAIVVVSACRDGIGSRHFFDLVDEWDAEKNCPRDGHPKFGSHKLSRINALSRNITVGIHCGVEDDAVRHVFYSPVKDINKFIEDRSKHTEGFLLAVVRDAGSVVLNKP